MKIAINGMFWNRSTTGSGQYIYALVSELARLGTEHHYVVFVPHQNDEPPDELPPHVSLRVEPIRFFRLRDNLGKVWFEQAGFPYACWRDHVALAHVPYFGAPRFSPTRLVVTIHDLIPLILPNYRGSLFVRTYMQLAAASARHADAIIADSEWSKQDIIARLQIDPARVRVIHLAADSQYCPLHDPARVAVVRQKYALPEKYLLYLGGYDQRKNVRVLIKAFARLQKYYDAGYRLVLAGVNLGKDSKFFPEPQRLAREAGLPDDAVQCLGWVDESAKPVLYSAATVFLFPSLYEGFGLPPLEAMACGTPVICANATSLPEVVGDAGVLVAPHSPAEWADAIRDLLDNPARRLKLREQGLAQAKKFSWRRTAQETLAVYTALASG